MANQAENDAFLALEKAVKECAVNGWCSRVLASDGCTTTIRVYYARLAASTLTELRHFPTLQALDFLSCEFEGAFPSAVCSLKSLAALSIDKCQDLNFPSQVIGLMKLQSLTIKQTSIAGGLQNVFQIKSLLRLSLNGSLSRTVRPMAQEASSVPAPTIGGLGTEMVPLQSSQHSGRHSLATIGNLAALEELSLTANELTGSELAHVGGLKALKTLNVSSNNLGDLPPELGQLAALEVLVCNECQLSGTLPPWMTTLLALKKLEVSKNQLTGPLPSALTNLRNLEVLDFSHNLFKELPEMNRNIYPAIKLVNFNFNELSGDAPPEFYFKHLLSGGAPRYIYSAGKEYLLTGEVYFVEKCGREGATIVDFKSWHPVKTWDRVPYDYVVVCRPQTFLVEPAALATIKTSSAGLVGEIFPALRVFLRKLCEVQNPCVLLCLVRLWYGLTLAAQKKPSESDELLGFANEVVRMVAMLFKARSLEHSSNLNLLLLGRKVWSNPEGKDDSLWRVMHLFEENSLIGLSMECKFKLVLAQPLVSDTVLLLFYKTVDFKEQKQELVNLNCLQYPRYTPVTMFLLEGLSKLAVLMLVSTVSIQVYGKEGHTSYANTAAEGCLVLMLCTHACYELGQLSAKNWNIVRHLSDPWNSLDVSALLLIFLWAVLCASGQNFSAARTVLSLSSIPLSLQLLQYISVVETIGLLVLMIQSMMVDVAIFIVVYFASIFGFGVCFYGLFYGSPSFDSSGATLLYLFQSTLGNFDFGALDGSTYYGIGTAVLVLFLVLTTVLLLNLLIAQMSSTYGRIKDKSKEEWSFIMASYVQEYVLLYESTPMCMLPPPLNAVTIALSPLHYWALKKYHISLAGTVADWILGLLVMPVKGLTAYFEILQDYSQFYGGDPDHEDHIPLWCTIWFLPLLPIAPIPYLLYMLVVTVVPRGFSFVQVSPIPTTSRLYQIRYYVKGQEERIAEYLRGGKQNSTETGSPSASAGVSSTLPTNASTDRDLQVSTGAGNYPLVANPLRREAASAEGTKQPSEALQSPPMQGGAATKPHVDAPKDHPSAPAQQSVAAQPILFTLEDITRIFSTALQNAMQTELQKAREEIKAMRDQTREEIKREMSVVREEMKEMNNQTQALLRVLLKQNPGK